MTRVSESKRDGRSFLRLSLVFVLAIVLSLGIIPLGDNGSSDAAEHRAPNADEIAIFTYEDLILIDDSSAGMGEKYILMADIDMSGENFVPLGANGSSPVQFTGSFDGNGYVISNMTIVGTDVENYRYAGLFAQLGSGSSVSNLGIVDSEINVTFSSGGEVYAGGIAGRSGDGTITNCYNTGSISSSSSSWTYAGGIVGEFNDGTITNCYNTGSAFSSSSSSDTYAGGVAGRSEGGTIIDCYNAGSVTGEATGTPYIRGIVYNYSGVTITNSFYLDTCGAASDGNEKTAAELRDPATYTAVSWDFSAVWTFTNAGAVNSGLPILKNTGYLDIFITEDPKDVTIPTSGDHGYIYFSTGAVSGEPISYEWEYFNADSGTDWESLPYGGGMNMETVSIHSNDYADGDMFRCKISNGGNTVYTEPAVLYIGTVTPPTVHYVTNVADLAEVGRGNSYTGGVWGPADTYIQTANITLTGSSTNFTPIPDFSGIYDGAGYTITNMNITITGGNIGMFDTIESGGIVKNVGLLAGAVVSSPTTGMVCVGGLAGVSDGTIVNCYNTGTVTIESTTAPMVIPQRADVGGIVGYSTGDIKDCYNTGDVTTQLLGNAHIGGIVGSIFYSSIMNCYNTGAVTALSNSLVEAGGIAGYIAGSFVVNCYNAGDISGKAPYANANAYVGGISGESLTSSISDCYNTGDLEAEGDRFVIAGGIVGRSATVSNCYNTGNVTVTSSSTNLYANVRAGGIIGHLGVAICCYSTGTIAASAGGGQAVPHVGGISTGDVAAIEDCYYVATAELSGEGGTWIDASNIDVMKFESTFEGWDFNNTWILLLIDGHVMPHLRAIMPEIYIHPANESRLSGDDEMRVTVNKQVFSGVYDWEYETSTPGEWLTAPAGVRIPGDPFAINAASGTNYRFVAQYTAYKGATAEVSGLVTSVEGCITIEDFYDVSSTIELRTDTSAPVGSPNGMGYVIVGNAMTPVGTDTVLTFFPEAGFAITDVKCDGTSVFLDMEGNTYTVPSATSGTTVLIVAEVSPLMEMTVAVEGLSSIDDATITYLVNGKSETPVNGKLMVPANVDISATVDATDPSSHLFQMWISTDLGKGSLERTFTFTTPITPASFTITSVFVSDDAYTMSISNGGVTGGEISIEVGSIILDTVLFGNTTVVPVGNAYTFKLTALSTAAEFQRWSSNIPEYNTFVNSLSITGLTGPTSIMGCFIPNGSPVLTVVYSGTPTGTVNFSFGSDVMIEVLTEINNVYSIPLGNDPVLLTPGWGVDAAFDTWLSTDITVSGWDPLLLNSGDILPLTAATVTAEFVPDEYIITATAGSGGSITPVGNITVVFRTDQAFTITPNNGGHISRVLVDGVEVGVNNTYVFNAVRDNHTIDVTFAAPRQYVVKISSDAGSTASPEGTVTVPYGAPLKIAIGALPGYKISDVLLDGSSISYSADSVTLSNIRSNCTVNIVSTYVGTIKLEITNIPNGGKAEYSVNGGDFQGYAGPVNIDKGSDVIIKITPPAGEKWRDSTDPSMVFFENVQSDILFDVFEEDTGGGDDGGKDNTMTYLIIILVILIIAAFIAVVAYRSRRST